MSAIGAGTFRSSDTLALWSDAPVPDSGASGGLPRGVSAALAAGALAVPIAMSRSTTPSPDHPQVMFWYLRLKKPFFKPPDIAIPIAWTLIDSGLAVAAYRLLRHPSAPARNRSLVWLAGNVLAIGGWSRLFFGRRNLAVSTVAAAAMVGTGAAYVAQARKTDCVAATAGVPLTAWVAFATVLTAALWRLNR
ncbi:MAG: tryptophan-rich sensory protein [Comamonadaceae bacterium]|nr:MAG: tryptophan-rich sensory protein [Comamonadaceae bacterium]